MSTADDTAAKPDTGKPEADKPATGIPALVQRVMKLKPVRVFQHYASNGGPLMAAGMSYQALFAVFAALWAGFSIAGLVLASNRELLEELVSVIGQAVPGLIGPDGAVDADALLNTPALSWSGAIALVGLAFTALGWLASARDAIRRIFSVGPDTTFFLLLKLKDAGLAIGFGVVLLVSAVVSIGSTSLLGLAFGVVGIFGGWGCTDCNGDLKLVVVVVFIIYDFIGGGFGGGVVKIDSHHGFVVV